MRTGYKQTSLGEIPEEWDAVPLEEISDEIYRYPTYFNIDYIDDRGVLEVRGEMIRGNGGLDPDMKKYRRISHQTSNRFPRTILREGDFVMSVRGTMGKVAIVSKHFNGANITANLMRLSIDRSKCYSPFLKQILISDKFQYRLSSVSSSTTIKTIQSSRLKSLKIPLPPLPEQKRIAEVLSTADDAVQQVEEAINKTERLKQGLMQKLLTEGIGHKDFNEIRIWTNNFLIPKNWDLFKFREICKVRQGLQIAINKRFKEAGENRYKYITIQYLNAPEKFKYFVENPPKSVLCKKDDILLTRTGNTGMVVTNQEGVFHNNFFLIDYNRKIVDRDFLKYYLSWDFIHEFLLIKAGTTTIPDLNHNDFYNTEFICPPLSEQKQIAEILSIVDRKRDLERERKTTLERIKKGLMNDLLTGRKRVKVAG
jgi:type I restriction enzyme S subunit